MEINGNREINPFSNKPLFLRDVSFYLYSYNVFYDSQDRFKFSITFNLSSANAFDLEKPKILSFGNELTFYHTREF